ncbi:hypothetical protein LTR05_007824 [Lithohypha guttulata]|uniref:Heterokaryon incompatibility domain-containing protein n=1 Tax=Lithohypha guttulata TaxID=1690604 RepID=A0AAN7SUA5_9EURO|nr:hypothetical protein LTR05_007824 [Lithohypha guttulata]
MRRQRKLNSLRRHYNESNLNGPNKVHWATTDPRTVSPLSSVSRRKSVRHATTGQRSSTTARTSSPSSKSSQTRKPSLGFDPARDASKLPSGLCSKCFEIALWHFQTENIKVQHHRNFVDLVKSARSCVLCLIFAKQAPVPPPNANFTYDGTKQIVLSATNRKLDLEAGMPGLALEDLIVHIPITRKDDQRNLTLPVQAQLVAPHNSLAARSGDVVRRRSHGGTNVDCAVEWLAECALNHKECRKSTDLIGSLMYAVPPRLLDVGMDDSSTVKLVSTDHSFVSPYVALTYTRGESKIASTNTANFALRQRSIGPEKFNKTFRQAISITRSLGFRYLWIEAYCILMDSSEDRTKHVPRMGIIFHNAALTLSASVSASADEGLIRYKSKSLPEVKIPYRNKDGLPLGHVFATTYKPRNFHGDVTKGDLNQRAWCLQARALSRRILHFGWDQLFWECDAGVWCEESSLMSPSKSLRDPLVEWRASLVKYKHGREPEEIRRITTGKTSRPTSALCDVPKIYMLWYSLVAQYTSRILPREKDKSSGIAGLAYVFACLISQRQTHTGPSKAKADTYLCGLWQNDLPFGLLWSAGSFHKWRNKFVKYPSSPRAPSWSWFSIDGPLQWPDGVVFSSGSFTGRSFMKLLQVGTHHDKRTDHQFSTLRVRGKIALLSRLYGFRSEDSEWKRAAREQDLANHGNSHEDAEGPIGLPCAMFDSAEVARVWTLLHGSNGDRPSTGSSSAEHTTSTRSQGFFSRSGRSGTTRRDLTATQPNLLHDQQKDFVALLVIPAGCSQADCQDHSFDSARLSGTLPLPADTAFRAKNNCGQGLAYALILYPSSMGEGLFRRVGIAQVRIADFATVERRRDREIVIV